MGPVTRRTTTQWSGAKEFTGDRDGLSVTAERGDMMGTASALREGEWGL